MSTVRKHHGLPISRELIIFCTVGNRVEYFSSSEWGPDAHANS
jgi:hypothetical protein